MATVFNLLGSKKKTPPNLTGVMKEYGVPSLILATAHGSWSH